MGVNPIQINIVDAKGKKIRTEELKVDVKDVCLVFNFSNNKEYEVCDGELQWGVKAMELTEAEYERLMALDGADNKKGITKADFTKANNDSNYAKKVSSKYGLFKDTDYNNTYYMGIYDKENPDESLQIYDT